MLWHSSFHVHANAGNLSHSTLESGRGLLDHVSTDVPLSLERAPLNPRPPAPPSPPAKKTCTTNTAESNTAGYR